MATQTLPASFLSCLIFLLGSDLGRPEASQRRPILQDSPSVEAPSSEQAASQAKLSIAGRVTHRGVPVADASVTLHDPPVPEGELPRLPWVKRNGTTDAEGRFRLPIERPKDYMGGLVAGHEYQLTVWHRELGEGDLGPLRIDLEHPPQDLELAITRAPGHIQGRVILPAGRTYRDVWLSTSRGHGFMRLQADGSYRLPGLPAGPLQIEILESYDVESSFTPASTTHFGTTEGGWFRLSHGPRRGPAWMTVLPSFGATVLSDETLEFDLDLAQPARCILKGRVTLNGSPLPFLPNDGGMFFPPTPRVRLFTADTLRLQRLLRGTTGHMICYSELGESAAFELRVYEPGSHCLDFTLALSKEEEIHLSRPIELTAGVQVFELALFSGSLVVHLAPEPTRRDYHGLQLRRELPDGTQLTYSGPRRSVEGVVRFESVPEGSFQVFQSQQRGQALLLEEVSIVAGSSTTLDLGAGD